MSIKRKTRKLFRAIGSVFKSTIYSKPKVMTATESIKYIIENKVSLSRFGDGEISLMCGVSLQFQKADLLLQKRLIEVSQSNNENVFVAIPDFFISKKLMMARSADFAVRFWRRGHLPFCRGTWYKYFGGRTFGDALMTRFYIDHNDKSHVPAYIELCKKLWDNRDIVFIEGAKSRLGVGNDLFDNSSSVRRIICPSEDAFDEYERILQSVKSNIEKEALIILALGPTATVMAYDLGNLGYQALDLGHIDIEYEWFLMGAKHKVPVPNKIIREAEGSNTEFDAIKDETYHQEIIATIGKEQ